jgi:hypothetical protein
MHELVCSGAGGGPDGSGRVNSPKPSVVTTGSPVYYPLYWSGKAVASDR